MKILILVIIIVTVVMSSIIVIQVKTKISPKLMLFFEHLASFLVPQEGPLFALVLESYLRDEY